MEFPNFEDFLATLDEDRMLELIGDMKMERIFQIQDAKDERNWNAFISEISMRIVSYSMVANLRVLRAYHEWLQQQIEQ